MQLLYYTACIICFIFNLFCFGMEIPPEKNLREYSKGFPYLVDEYNRTYHSDAYEKELQKRMKEVEEHLQTMIERLYTENNNASPERRTGISPPSYRSF